jgi:hypothetical protein
VRIALLFQTIETVNESAQNRQGTLDEVVLEGTPHVGQEASLEEMTLYRSITFKFYHIR